MGIQYWRIRSGKREKGAGLEHGCNGGPIICWWIFSDLEENSLARIEPGKPKALGISFKVPNLNEVVSALSRMSWSSWPHRIQTLFESLMMNWVNAFQRVKAHAMCSWIPFNYTLKPRKAFGHMHLVACPDSRILDHRIDPQSFGGFHFHQSPGFSGPISIEKWVANWDSILSNSPAQTDIIAGTEGQKFSD